MRGITQEIPQEGCQPRPAPPAVPSIKQNRHIHACGPPHLALASPSSAAPARVFGLIYRKAHHPLAGGGIIGCITMAAMGDEDRLVGI
jgi:hypothetical protein